MCTYLLPQLAAPTLLITSCTKHTIDQALDQYETAVVKWEECAKSTTECKRSDQLRMSKLLLGGTSIDRSNQASEACTAFFWKEKDPSYRVTRIKQ